MNDVLEDSLEILSDAEDDFYDDFLFSGANLYGGY